MPPGVDHRIAMGSRPYLILGDSHLPELQSDGSNCVVEIGSERGEGSTAHLRDWAAAGGMDFHTVDVTLEAQRRFVGHPGVGGINFHVVDSGHAWCRDTLPGLGRRIAVLYLDNFDWTWAGSEDEPWIHEQIADYARRGVVMNNENSQEEHRLQTLYCLPYMAAQSIIIMDDTFPDRRSPTGWGGKCGTAMPLILAAGYTVAARYWVYTGATKGGRLVCGRGVGLE